ncbi:DUF6049 family protein [Nocardiopsis sp. NPDC101807]|uniref:DUF6049 family protein n=1 Tax=Nocardiopsis sp. NPDC101807 TaxID=3364339 RepID=UPI00381A3E09
MAMTTALLPIPAAHSPALADPEDDGSVEPLVVERITPDAVREDSTLRIAGEVTNTTADSVRDVTVRVRYSRHPFTNRDELDEFASGDGWQPNAPGPDEEVASALPPDASEEYSLSVPVEDLDLSSYGVYPLVVEAVDGDGGVIGSQYTFLPYTGSGGDDVPSVDIAWVWPLMDRPQRADDDTFLSGELRESVRAEGRLGRLLSSGAQVPLDFAAGEEDLVELLGLGEEPGATPPEEDGATEEETADSVPSEEAAEDGGEDDEEQSGAEGDGGGEEPGAEGDGGGEEPGAEEESRPARTEGVPITWAVDPGTLDDVHRMAAEDHEVLEDLLAVPAEADPVRHGAGADESAQVWLREARAVLARDTVVASPYAGADLGALLRNDMGDDAAASLRLGQEAVLRALSFEADGAFAMPPGGMMDDPVYELYAAQGATRFLLAEDAMPPASWMSTTPTAQAPLAAPEEEPVEDPFALVADAGITDVLSMPSWEPGESALALQRFAAETAMIAGENAGGDRVVVASPDPGWDPSPEFADGVLAASDDLPWLSPEKLDEVEPADADEREDTRRNLDYPDSASEDELSPTYLGLVEDVNNDVRLFNSVLVDDVDPFRPALLRLASVYWREEEALAGATRSLVLGSVQDRMGDVRVIPGEPVTLASQTGTTGVLVANDLEDQAVIVRLSVFSENSERLSIGSYTDFFEIDPGAKTTVYVPLSARVNGRTELTVSLHNSAGEPISTQDTVIPVNATGLGTQALLISGIGLLILVAALAPRALRKWARKQASRSDSAESGAGGQDGAATGGDEGDGPDGPDGPGDSADPAPPGAATTPGDPGAPGEAEASAPSTGSGGHTAATGAGTPEAGGDAPERDPDGSGK